MEEVGSSSPAGPDSTGSPRRSNQETSGVLGLKKSVVGFAVSLQEGFRYFKASLFALAKKMTARSEKEASEADLQAARMQVEAADAAEDKKNNLLKSN